jgi:sarcosine oxidase
MRTAVVGAGIMGASAARFLADRGHNVTVFEQFELGHALGSSHGRSRIVRKAYPDPFYTEIMQEAYPMWAELEAMARERLLFECGLLYFGPEGAENMLTMRRGLEELSVSHESLSPSEMGRVFPGLRLEEGEIGIFTPEAGWVRADLAIRLSLDAARDKGATIRREHADSVETLEREFDAVVLCAGPWITKLLDLPMQAQARTFAYLEARQEGPVWIEEGPGLHYGFPTEPGEATIKIGGHAYDQPFDPDRAERPVLEENLEAIRDLARRRFGLGDPSVREARTCLYTWRASEDFAVGRVSDKTVFASPCSGHGFKFGPWIGRLMADFVEGRAQPEAYPRWNTRPAVLA